MIYFFIITKVLATEVYQFPDSFTSQIQYNQSSRTYVYNPFNDSNKYILFELYVSNFIAGQSHLLMTASLNQIPINQSDGNIDSMYLDLNAYYENSTYHNILIKPTPYNQNDTFYITIFNRDKVFNYWLVYVYRLNVTSNFYPICPNICSKQGTCNLGICDCQQSFVDIDCSKIGVKLLMNSNITYNVNGQGYLYYQHQNISTNNITIYIQNVFEISVYLMMEDFVFEVPSSHNYISKNDNVKKNTSFIVETSQIKYLPELQRFERVIISIYSTTEQVILLQVQQVQPVQNTSDNENDSRIRIVYYCAGAAVLLVLILIIICCLRSKFQSNPRPQQKLINNANQEINLQIINQYLPKYQYQRVFDTILFKTKSQTKKLNEICTVCLLEFEDNTECRFTPCLHIFHSECLELWLLKHQNCPNCRLKINHNELVKYELEFKSHLDLVQKQQHHIQKTPTNNFQIDEYDQHELILQK